LISFPVHTHTYIYTRPFVVSGMGSKIAC
jgi:hypothetical protein